MEHFRLVIETVAGIGVLCAFMMPFWRFIEAQAKRTVLMEEGVQSMLHDRIYQVCNFYLSRGFVTVADLKNLEHMYTPYAAMGGNGTAKELYERVLDLAIKED